MAGGSLTEILTESISSSGDAGGHLVMLLIFQKTFMEGFSMKEEK